jgi:hypothetical protein
MLAGRDGPLCRHDGSHTGQESVLAAVVVAVVNLLELHVAAGCGSCHGAAVSQAGATYGLLTDLLTNAVEQGGTPCHPNPGNRLVCSQFDTERHGVVYR